MPKNSAIIFREYDLAVDEREKMAREILVLCRGLGHKMLVGKNLELARKIKADGVHFSDKDGLLWQNFQRKNLPQKFIFSLACHNFLSVVKSQKTKADLIFVSPVFKTKSHPNLEPLGLMKFGKIVAASQIPIFALGGVNEKNFLNLKKLGAVGFGAIDQFI